VLSGCRRLGHVGHIALFTMNKHLLAITPGHARDDEVGNLELEGGRE
jgi:hypothetical protein